MTENKNGLDEFWLDPDDAPEWKEEHFQRAQLSVGGKVIRQATGTYTKRGRPKSDDPKQQVTLRLDSAVLEKFRAMGPRWQSRINAELRKVLGI